MEKCRLGNSDIYITRVGIGAWAMDVDAWRWSQQAQRDRDAIAAIHQALECGINWIDTGAVYGCGHSEEVVGRALRLHSTKPFIFTKCEHVWDANGRISASLKASSIRKQCEASLRRLSVDKIDLYQIHWPEPDRDIELGWTEMARLKEEGKVRYIGVCNFSVAQMERAQRIAPITSLQHPYSLLAREMEQSILPFASNQKIGVIVYSPTYSGMFDDAITDNGPAIRADDWRQYDPNFNEPLMSQNLRLAELLNEIGLRRGRSATEVAIAWTLRSSAVTAAIVNVRSPKHASRIAQAGEFQLTIEELEQLRQLDRRKVA